MFGHCKCDLLTRANTVLSFVESGRLSVKLDQTLIALTHSWLQIGLTNRSRDDVSHNQFVLLDRFISPNIARHCVGQQIGQKSLVQISLQYSQQNRIIKHNNEQGSAKVIIRTRDNRRFMVEMQFGINMS